MSTSTDGGPPEPRVTDVMVGCPHPACWSNVTMRIVESWAPDGAASIAITMRGHVNPADVDPSTLPVVPGHEVI